MTDVDEGEAVTLEPVREKFGTFRICEQRKLRRDCVVAQSRLSPHCSYTQRRDLDEGPGKFVGL